METNRDQIIENNAMQDEVVTDVAGLPVVAFPMSHGPAGRTTGFRCGGMAWLTDLKVLPPEADAHLRDLDLLVLDMLRDEEHSTHLNWAEAQQTVDARQVRLHPTL